MLHFKCVECQSLFTRAGLKKYTDRTGCSTRRMKCPVCNCQFTTEGLKQPYVQMPRAPSVREVDMDSPITASPDDR